ncbi:hypothetical protein AB0M68_03515 [Streptomyces sp. NPDC051453]|uniref:hypothetical protein n=1 Tax=Streptomyces sp. NPDC051453 TaxID=3154941 RepID=UPI00342AEB59
MPTAGDQVPGGTTAIARRLAALERQVAELRATRRLEKAAIGKGGLGIRDGGELLMTTPDDQAMMHMGPAVWNHLDGSRQQQFVLRREDGTMAVGIYANPDAAGSDTQAVTFWDRNSNIIFADDTSSGVGLGRPYLPITLAPGYDGGWDYWPRTTVTTLQELWAGGFYMQHPKLTVVVRASMDTSGATGEVQLKLDGATKGTAASVGFGVGYYTLGPFVLDGGHMSQHFVSVMARKASGSGAIRAVVHSAYTHQT